MTEPGVSTPCDITTGPDGNLWFTVAVLPGIARMSPTTHAVDVFYRCQRRPAGRNRAALWFTSSNNDRIGRIAVDGSVQTFTDTGADDPQGITAGPDGALWFTSANNDRVGRITTSGHAQNYTAGAVDVPTGITAGPDGALWFTNQRDDSVGYHDGWRHHGLPQRRRRRAERHHCRSRRQPVVRQPGQRSHRTDRARLPGGRNGDVLQYGRLGRALHVDVDVHVDYGPRI